MTKKAGKITKKVDKCRDRKDFALSIIMLVAAAIVITRFLSK